MCMNTLITSILMKRVTKVFNALIFVLLFSLTSAQETEKFLAVVEKDSLYGIIDINGNWYIQNTYDYIHEISEGYVHAVKQDRKDEGFIHLKSKTFIPLELWNNGHAVAEYNSLAVFDYTFLYTAVKNNDTVYIPSKIKNDNLVTNAVFCDSLVKYNYTFIDGVAPIGFISEIDLKDHYYSNTWGYISKTGMWIEKPKHSYTWLSSEGILLLFKGDEVIFKSIEGRILDLKNYNAAMSFSESFACVGVGDSLVSQWHNFIQFRKGKWGFIDLTGKEVIPLKFDYAKSFSEGLASVCIQEKWGFINKDGDIVIPLKYDAVTSFSSGLSGVMIDSLWGIINSKGELLVNPVFEEFKGFNNGRAAAKFKGKWGYLDTSGEYIIQPVYSYSFNFFNANDKNCLDCLIPINIFAHDNEVIDLVLP